MESLMYDIEDFEQDALANSQPIKISEDWCNMVKLSSPGDHSRSRF